MVKVHHLQSKLKSLRLGGMLDTLELRLDQAQKDHLGYLQFLELMLEDEINRRSQRVLASRIAKAHFEEIKTLEEFDFGFNPKIPAQKIRDLATCNFLEAGESVIVCGPVGTGKPQPMHYPHRFNVLPRSDGHHYRSAPSLVRTDSPSGRYH